MLKEENRFLFSSILALTVGLLLIACVALPFATVIVSGLEHSRIYWSSGSAIASGDPGIGVTEYGLEYLIPIGGVISLLPAALALVPQMKRSARAVGILVPGGGLFALYGCMVTLLRLSLLFGTTPNLIGGAVTTTLGIGLFGALILVI
jgi:hypothetical protein